MIVFHGCASPKAPRSWASPTGSVRSSLRLAAINGWRNSFHEPTVARIVNVITAGRAIGRTTWVNVLNRPAPSMAAASSISTGICSMNCFITKMPTASNISGRISPA